jgi:hypothetical protein
MSVSKYFARPIVYGNETVFSINFHYTNSGIIKYDLETLFVLTKFFFGFPAITHIYPYANNNTTG